MKTKRIIGGLWAAALASCALALATGCASDGTGGVKIPPKEQRCEAYQSAYAVYMATTAVRPVSKEESAAALVAVAFLRIHCGWKPETIPSAGLAASADVEAIDANGVPIIRPPNASIIVD